MFFKRRLSHKQSADDAKVDELAAIVGEQMQLIRGLLSELRAVGRESRATKAEMNVMMLVVSNLLGYVADETSQQQTIDVVLSNAETIVASMAEKYGADSVVHQDAIKLIREFAEARISKSG